MLEALNPKISSIMCDTLDGLARLHEVRSLENFYDLRARLAGRHLGLSRLTEIGTRERV